MTNFLSPLNYCNLAIISKDAYIICQRLGLLSLEAGLTGLDLEVLLVLLVYVGRQITSTAQQLKATAQSCNKIEKSDVMLRMSKLCELIKQMCLYNVIFYFLIGLQPLMSQFFD